MGGTRITTRDSGRRAVWTVTLVTALAYLLFALMALALHGGDPLWFAWLGTRFTEGVPGGSIGYDGQFVYAIAIDGLAAAPRLDNPAYRLQRILLPAVAGVVSGGQPAAVAWAIPLLNWGAIVGAGYLLACWLAERRISPWYSLVFTGYVGSLMAFSRNLTEPLMALLAIGGVIAWQRRRAALAAIWLGLAMLAKEIALLFVLGLVCHTLSQRRYRPLAWLGASLLPWLAWQGALYRQFGVLPWRAGPSLESVPLWGILGQLSWEPGRLSALLFVALPALALTGYALWRLGREREARQSVGLVLVLVHAAALLIMPAAVYDHLMHAGRNAIGLAVSLVFAMGELAPWERRFALAAWVGPTAAWLIPILRWSPWS